LSDVDGTAATPAIRGTDTNTGIFFPAADTIAFSEGGAEVARFDSAGNLGIGTSSPLAKLDVTGGLTISTLAGWNTLSNTVFKLANPAVRLGVGYSAADIPLVQGFDSSNAARDIAMQVYGGNLLVGTTSGSFHRLFKDSPSDFAVASVNTSATTPYGHNVTFTAVAPNNATSMFLRCDDTGYTGRIQLRSNGGIANFSANNVNLSDRRAKTNFAPAKSYLDTICAIPVQTFNFIDQNMEEDGGLTLGVVAQDVQAVAPEMVMESNWGTEEEPKMRLSIYQTDLQYALMKCIQEQQAIITQLQADVAALKGTA
jgi:hypothetical protein